ncbi:tetratricopeptide repeat protein [Nocardia miyunensis]|uniref:tetratricopeptide repeat protein n=1 Tax=Nocardia miyunensis TaxID=282684 RepID=UPI00082BF355|nr:hypothetical protein [Nocardia miyunensis]
MNEQLTTITERDRPESFIGRVVEINSLRYRIGPIIGEGVEKIVFELEDLEDGGRERVLKVHRKRSDAAYLDQLREINDVMAGIERDMGLRVIVRELHFLGDWPVELQTRIFGVEFGHAGLRLRSGSSQVDEAFRQIEEDRSSLVRAAFRRAVDRFNIFDYEATLQIVEPVLETHPMHPDLLFVSVMATARMGHSVRAGQLANQWLETGSNPDHLVHMVKALMGTPNTAITWCYKAVRVVDDTLKVWELLCELEITRFGRVEPAERARAEFASAGAAPDVLAGIDAQLERLRAVSALLEHFNDPAAMDTLEFAEAARTMWPYHVGVNRLLGLSRYSAEQWQACIDPLRMVYLYEPHDPEIVFALGSALHHQGRIDTPTNSRKSFESEPKTKNR